MPAVVLGCSIVLSGSQLNSTSYRQTEAANTFTNLDSRAHFIMAPYTSDAEKVRTIFNWIAENIDTGKMYNNESGAAILLPPVPKNS